MSLLDLVCFTENEPMLRCLATELDYFRDVVDLPSEINGGWTPLLWATQRQNLEIAQTLVENDADINIGKSEDGMTVYHISASNNDIHMLDYFLE